MTSITNFIKKNPRTSTVAGVFLIALIVVIVWLVTRGGQAGPGVAGSTMVPELTVSGMKTVKSVNTSEYTPVRYEYALGDFKGDNIDYDITINTKGGFQENNISKLVIHRRKATTTGDILDTKTINGITNYTEYKQSFLGSDLATDAVAATGGDNYFEVIGYVVVDSVETMYGTSPLASTTIAIPEADLNYTLPASMTTTFDWTITSGGTGFGVSQGTLERTKYHIAFTDKPVSLIPVIGGGYKFKFDDGSFFTVDTQKDFKLDKFGDKYRLYNGTKIVTKTDGTGVLVLKAPNDMTAAEAAAAMTEIAPASAPKVYPPKPYPNATGGTTVTNSYKWTVAGSGYGEGEYRVEAANSLLIDATFDGSLDAEGLFNKGISSTAVYDGGEPAYHSSSGGAVSWFHFYLPVYIKLDRVDIVSRGHSDEEITNMKSKWYVSGVDRSSGTPVETRLYSNDNVTFTKGETKSLVATPSKKFNEFKVTMDPIGTAYMVFNELLFYGTEDTMGFQIKDNYHSDVHTGVTPAVYGSNQYAELGAGNSMAECRTLATNGGWKAYGHRKKENNCWAIKDVGIVSNGLISDSNHSIGCTDAGKTIDGNCGYDVRKGQHVVRSAYDVSDASGADYPGVSMDDCRKLAESKNWKAFGHRTKDHPTNPNTCWGITGTWTSGDIEAIDNHSIGCTETGKMLADGCN